MDRRDFLKKGFLFTTFLSTNLLNPNLVLGSLKSDNEIKHAINVFRNSPKTFLTMHDDFNVRLEIILSMIAVEHGKPYDEFETGLRVHSGTGCYGIPQITYGSMQESIEWINILNSNRQQRNAKEVESEIAKLNPSRDLFKDLFQGPKVKVENQAYSTINLQSHLMASYFNKYISCFKSTDLSIIAYNFGPPIVANMIGHLTNTKVDVNNQRTLQAVIRENNISGYNLLSNPKSKQYVADLKRRGILHNLADERYLVKVRQKERYFRKYLPFILAEVV